MVSTSHFGLGRGTIQTVLDAQTVLDDIRIGMEFIRFRQFASEAGYGTRPATGMPAIKLLKLSVIYCLIAFFVLPALSAQENRNDKNLLLLPTSIDARGKLKQSCQLSNEKPLRNTLQEIHQVYQLPFWIDRRVDLLQPAIIRGMAESQTLGEELIRLAASCGIQGGLVENIYLMAPSNRLSRAQRSAVVFHGQLASKNKALADTVRPIDWPDITSSNEVLQIIARTWSVDLMDYQLPHDLFHERTLPKCSLATQLALLLSGFDLQATLDPASTKERIRIKIEPLSNSSAWEDSYERLPTETFLKDLQSRYPNAGIELSRKDGRGVVKVRGETNLHNDLLMPPTTKRATNPRQEKRLTFELPTRIPVEPVVKKLSQDMNFEVIWSPECNAKHRGTLIQVALKNVTRAELLQAIADAAELRFVDEGERLLIYPK